MSHKDNPTVPKYILEITKTSLDFLEDFADSLPLSGKGPISAVKRVITLVEAVKTNHEDVVELESHLLQLALVIANATKPPPSSSDPSAPTPTTSYPAHQLTAFIKKLNSIARDLERLKATTDAKGVRKFFRALLFSTDTAGVIKKCTAKLDSEMRLFEVGLKINDALQLDEVKNGVISIRSTLSIIQDGVQTLIDTSQLAKLPQAPLASFDAFDSKRSDPLHGCLEGTRTKLLQDLRSWVERIDYGAPFIYYLNGMAGTGKSTIAHSVAVMAREAGVLGASFFFAKHSDATLSDPTLVFTTIAYQLAQFDTSQEFKNRIVTAVLKDPSLLSATTPNLQFTGLIREPLRQAVGYRDRVVLVVLDALDECEPRGAEAILHALAAAASSNPFPFRLKFFITSRPETHITSILNPSDPAVNAGQPSSELTVSLLRDIEQSIVEADIRFYMRTELDKIGATYRSLRKLPEPWYTEEELEILVKQAGTLFIFAATLMRFVGDKVKRDPRGRLNLILRSGTSSGLYPFQLLDALYTEVLQATKPPALGAAEEEENDFVQFREVVAMVLFLQELLSVTTMARLANRDPVDVHGVLEQLHSVIFTRSLEDSPQIHHPSFPDFICDDERCTRAGLDKRFVINVEQYHGQLAQWCFTLMDSFLKDGILGELDPEVPNSEIEGLGDKLDKILGPHGRYAMRYWASHLSRASCEDVDLMKAVEEFASNNSLRWLEGMSLMEDMTYAGRALLSAIKWAPPRTLVSSLLSDSHRLLLLHSQDITKSAGHLYRCALPFVPRGTQLYKTFEREVKRHIDVVAGCEDKWPVQSAALRGHTGPVRSVSFSPGGKQIASGSEDNSIIFWDVDSGSVVQKLEGHSASVASVSFSPDGKHLASGSRDNTVLVWDAVSGSVIRRLESHTEEVLSVSFSADGKHIASGSDDCTVILWDALSGSVVRKLKGHTWTVSSVSIAPDGKQIASGSWDMTIIVWDVLSGSVVQKLEGHTSWVLSVSFSPDSKQIASGSDDKTVMVWDAVSGSVVHQLDDHTGSVLSVTFSPDGTRIASGSDGGTIIVSDAVSGSTIRTLESHTIPVASVSFSPDGKQLASGSLDDDDNTVVVWDIACETAVQELAELPNRVICLSFSPDDKLLAAGRSDDAVVWDTVSGSVVWRFQGHKGSVLRIAFSPDGMQVTSGSLGQTITWDITTGEPLDPIHQKHTLNWHKPTPRSPPAPFLFGVEVNSRTLYAEDATQKRRLICVIPPSFPLDVRDWKEGKPTVTSGAACVAWGCTDGRIAIIWVKRVGGVVLI